LQTIDLIGNGIFYVKRQSCLNILNLFRGDSENETKINNHSEIKINKADIFLVDASSKLDNLCEILMGSEYHTLTKKLVVLAKAANILGAKSKKEYVMLCICKIFFTIANEQEVAEYCTCNHRHFEVYIKIK
jgi:hypothetical protein